MSFCRSHILALGFPLALAAFAFEGCGNFVERSAFLGSLALRAGPSGNGQICSAFAIFGVIIRLSVLGSNIKYGPQVLDLFPYQPMPEA